MKSIPIPVITFLVAQLGAAVWWGAQITSTANFAEETAVENRRYISEVVIPSMKSVIVGTIHTIITG